MTTRLRLICHASTQATRHSAFPGDEPLDALGLRAIAGLTALPAGRRLTSPALRARQTAAVLLPGATPDPALRDCDYGRWTGQTLAAVQQADPDGVAAWLGDPAAAPHGGESVLHLIERAAAWLAVQAASPGQVVAITHAAVIRAAIVAAIAGTPQSFARIDVAPLSCIRLSAHGGRWTLAGLGGLAAQPSA